MKRLSFLLGILVIASLISGCSSRWVRSPVVDQKNIAVDLEHQEIKGRVVEKQFSHPFEIDPKDLEIFLGQLEYFDEPALYGDPEKRPLFQSDEVARLGPAIAEALAKATPHQRVRFISYNKGGGLLFKKQRKTRGVVFANAADHFNIAFSLVNYEIRERELQRLSQGPEMLDPLEITSSETPIIAPDYAYHQKMKNGEEYPLWVVANVNRIKKDTAADAEYQESAVEADQPKAREKPETAAEPAKAFSEEPPAADKPPADGADDTWETRKQEIRNKLEYLKELYESDLIDAKDYDTQKKKLLDQLQQ